MNLSIITQKDESKFFFLTQIQIQIQFFMFITKCSVHIFYKNNLLGLLLARLTLEHEMLEYIGLEDEQESLRCTLQLNQFFIFWFIQQTS